MTTGIKKVCKDCGKGKLLEDFPKQYTIPKNKHYSSDGHRHDCKLCHQKKNKANWHKRSLKYRRKYMREYMRKYNKL